MSTNETPPATAPQEEASKAPQDGSVHLVEIVAPFTDTYIYSNISALSASFMDVRISFGEMSAKREAPNESRRRHATGTRRPSGADAAKPIELL